MTRPGRTEPDAVVLLSGGLDSTTVLAIAIDAGRDPLALTFSYGQTHGLEVERSRAVAEAAGTGDPLVLPLPFREIGGSALLGESEIPPEPPGGAGSGGIPPTYVPARNLVFLSLAAAVAEARGIRELYIGVNALDYSGYPDCRPEFIDAFQRAANLGTREGSEHGEAWFRVHTPLIALPKSEIIRRGAALGVDYSLTLSCYDPDGEGRACGRCDACGLRRRGFEEAGLPDPTLYR